MAVKLIEPGNRPQDKREILVSRDEFLIGRGADCDLVLNESVISRHHCLLRLKGKTCILTDLGSSNGTYLNGHRLISQTTVKAGDELRVGSFRFLIDEDDQDNVVWGGTEGANPTETTMKIARIQATREQTQKEPLTDGPDDEAQPVD